MSRSNDASTCARALFRHNPGSGTISGVTLMAIQNARGSGVNGAHHASQKNTSSSSAT